MYCENIHPITSFYPTSCLKTTPPLKYQQLSLFLSCPCASRMRMHMHAHACRLPSLFTIKRHVRYTQKMVVEWMWSKAVTQVNVSVTGSELLIFCCLWDRYQIVISMSNYGKDWYPLTFSMSCICGWLLSISYIVLQVLDNRVCIHMEDHPPLSHIPLPLLQGLILSASCWQPLGNLI